MRAPIQEVRLSNGYRAVGWEPFMGISGMAMIKCPEFEGREVIDTIVDINDYVTCMYDDGSIYKWFLNNN